MLPAQSLIQCSHVKIEPFDTHCSTYWCQGERSSLYLSLSLTKPILLHHSPWHRPLLCCFAFFMYIQPFPTIALPGTLTAHSFFSHPWVYTYNINILCFEVLCVFSYICAQLSPLSMAPNPFYHLLLHPACQCMHSYFVCSMHLLYMYIETHMQMCF